jgi:hypothetical protein
VLWVGWGARWGGGGGAAGRGAGRALAVSLYDKHEAEPVGRN